MDNAGHKKTMQLSLFVGLIALFCFSTSQALGKDVTIGVFAYQGERASTSDWNPLISYLNRALPEHHFRLENHDAESLRQAISGERIDLAITNPGHYITMEAEFGLSRIAVVKMGSPRAYERGMAIGKSPYRLIRSTPPGAHPMASAKSLHCRDGLLP
jgi:ABC-type phosphate/phosphonate transport system substrate-binding protein